MSSTDHCRGGFTLAEMLVAMALLAVLSALVTPSMLVNIGKGERSRVAEDLQSTATSAQMFNTDLKRWPSTMGQLASTVGATDTDVLNEQYGATLASRWNGPYFDRGGDIGTTLKTGSGGRIRTTFGTGSWEGRTYLKIEVEGIDEETAKQISQLLEGESLVGTDGTGDANGRVRWQSGNPSVLIYLARQLD